MDDIAKKIKVQQELHLDLRYKRSIYENINQKINEQLVDDVFIDEEISKYSLEMTNLNEKVINKVKAKINLVEEEIKVLQEESKKILEESKKNGCKNIKELYNLMSKEAQYHNQSQIFSKILNDSEYAKIYLSSYEDNVDKKKKDVIGSIKVLGTFNFSKNQREEYEIKVYKDSNKGSFWCNCPDHKFNSTKKGTVCKHITFIVCKVHKYLKLSFFDNKKLPEEELTKLIEKLKSDSIWKDKGIAKKYKKITLELFKEQNKEIDEEDVCPICYDNLEEADKTHLLSCPQCSNYAHDECMEVWLENRDTCVYCKDDIWKNYKTLFKAK